MIPMLSVALLSLTLSQAPSLKQARAIVADVYAGRSSEAWKSASASLRGQVRNEAGLRALISKVRSGLGTEVRLITESMSEKDGGTVYRRVSAVTNWARGMELELRFDADGQLTALRTLPARNEAPTVAARYKTKTPLRLPFDGSWFVLWAGRKYEENRHASVPDMRFAMDVFIVGRTGTSTGSGKRNEDYLAWGQPMLAPAAGVVVEVVNDAIDNPPNQPKPGAVYGNYLVIDHGEGEFSLLAHLQRGSVSVKKGQRVRAGQQLARCGNSGMSTEPHLHYQLMDDADWRKAQGLPAQFTGYVANERLVELGEPMRTQVIAPASVAADLHVDE